MFCQQVMLLLFKLFLIYLLCIFLIYITNHSLIGRSQDDSRSYIDIRLELCDEQSHQIGRDIYLQCSVHGSVERPYEYTFTKDGRSLEDSMI